MQFRIKEARTAANLTQRELADMLGIKDATLSGYETGAHDPKSNTLAEIARICHTTVDFLLGLDEKIQPAGDDGLDDSEGELVAIYRDLNDKGQTILINTARGLASNPDMKRGGASSAGTTA